MTLRWSQRHTLIILLCKRLGFSLTRILSYKYGRGLAASVRCSTNFGRIAKRGSDAFGPCISISRPFTSLAQFRRPLELLPFWELCRLSFPPKAWQQGGMRRSSVRTSYDQPEEMREVQEGLKNAWCSVVKPGQKVGVVLKVRRRNRRKGSSSYLNKKTVFTRSQCMCSALFNYQWRFSHGLLQIRMGDNKGR